MDVLPLQLVNCRCFSFHSYWLSMMEYEIILYFVMLFDVI